MDEQEQQPRGRTVYEENGYRDRRDYLDGLAEEYPRGAVMALANMLGPAEDFDGLLTMLEDEFGGV